MSKGRSFTEYKLNDLRLYCGWLPFIEIAFDKIEEYLKKHPSNFKITGIKDKYGGIRFEEYNIDDYCCDILWDLENDSHSICEKCGCKGESRGGGRIYTLCDYCYDLSLKHKDA